MTRLLTALAAVVCALAGLAVPAVGAAAGPGVCDGVAGCRVVGRADVDGDGSRDDIGVAARGRAATRSVIVRVRTRNDRIVSVRAPAQFWLGSFWQGAAHLDGRDGAELVVGYVMGAHTVFYRALTWRGGRLVTLGAPGPDIFWVVDSAAFDSLGWQQLPRDPAGTIRQLSATRTGSSLHDPFRGTVTRYLWTPHGWRTEASRTVFPMTDRAAAAWGGFHVPGLPRW
jgi:hypothetical protein